MLGCRLPRPSIPSRGGSECVLARSRRSLVHLLSLWLSLVMVLGHAMAPAASPLNRTSGSAFSVGTVEVSLGPSRPGLAAKLKRTADGAERSAGPDNDQPAILPLSVLESMPPAGVATPVVAPASFVLGRTERPFNARAPPRG